MTGKRKRNPYVMLMALGIAIVLTGISIAFVFRDTNYAVPKESELQYIEGVVEKYEPCSGRGNIYYELSLKSGDVYYLNQYISYAYGIERYLSINMDKQEKLNVSLGIDKNYKEHIPNQIYSIELADEEILSYEESSEYVQAYYKDSLYSSLKFLVVSFVVVIAVSIYFAVGFLRFWEKEMATRKRKETESESSEYQ